MFSKRSHETILVLNEDEKKTESGLEDFSIGGDLIDLSSIIPEED